MKAHTLPPQPQENSEKIKKGNVNYKLNTDSLSSIQSWYWDVDMQMATESEGKGNSHYTAWEQ